MSSTYSHQVNTDNIQCTLSSQYCIAGSSPPISACTCTFSRGLPFDQSPRQHLHVKPRTDEPYSENEVINDYITMQVMGTTTKKQRVPYQKWWHNSVVNVKLTWFTCLNCSVCKKYNSYCRSTFLR